MEELGNLEKPENNIKGDKKPNIEENNIPIEVNLPPKETLAHPTLENMPTERPKKATIPNKTDIRVYRLPNAMVDRDYEVELTSVDLAIDEYIVDIDGLEEYGLTFDKENCLISGNPKMQGEAVFIVTYKLEQIDAGPLLDDKVIKILINPNPRSLWKNVEPTEDAPFFKSHIAANSFSFQEQTVVGASKRGRSHAHEGIFRDDHFLIEKIDEEWLFMSVADGAGSAKYSREGSKIACETTFQTIQSGNEVLEKLDKAIIAYATDLSDEGHYKVKTHLYQLFGSGVYVARKAIAEKAKENEYALRDFSTTLIITIYKKYDFGYFVAAYAVGDGGVGIYSKSDDIILLSKPDGGEYAGQTRFLTMSEIGVPENIMQRIQFSIVPDFTSLVLMTDGITDPKFQTDANFLKNDVWKSFWDELSTSVDFKSEKSAQQLTDWLDFWSPGNHDDRTIALLVNG